MTSRYRRKILERSSAPRIRRRLARASTLSVRIDAPFEMAPVEIDLATFELPHSRGGRRGPA